MWPTSQFQHSLNIELPIIQAPMAGSSGLAMAVAVAEAGGLGSLACAAMAPPALRDTLAGAKERTRKPLNVNFFAHVPGSPDDKVDQGWLRRLSPYFETLGLTPPEKLGVGSIIPFGDEHCAVIEASPPAVISFHFGLPSVDLVRRIQAVGAKVMSSATTVAEARWLACQGCDYIIAQGYEAGGHRGMFLSTDVATQVGTLALVPQITDAVDVPVIAAGGIGDGRGIAAAFALGASGVQIGTAYLFTEEASISEGYRAALRLAPSLPTALTNVFSGRPARCLENRLMREQGPLADNASEFPRGFAAAAPLRAAAELHGSRDFSADYCGQAVALGQATSAAQLTKDLAADAISRFRWLAGNGQRAQRRTIAV